MKTTSSLPRLPALPAALLLAATLAFSPARAATPTAPPVFDNPTQITNAFFPFQRGGSKVFAGSDHGARATALDLYLTETRTFLLNGSAVECAILREVNFEAGELVESTDNYFAQATNGAVYYFGEVVDNYEDGVIVNHDGSWLVGGKTRPTDPDDTGNAPIPAVFMPATPEVGDTFKPEDLFPIVDETALVLRVGTRLVVPAARFRQVIVVRETTRLNTDVGLKFYASGVGVVQARSRGEILRLVASTLVQVE